MGSLRQEFREFRDMVSGRTEREARATALVNAVLLVVVQEIRRDYLARPRSDEQDPAYERGYGDAVLDMTRRIEAAIKRQQK
jgi:hypothetical protein